MVMKSWTSGTHGTIQFQIFIGCYGRKKKGGGTFIVAMEVSIS
jgi:hypothetical protein